MWQLRRQSKNIAVLKIIPVINRSVDMLDRVMTHSALLQETIETHRAIGGRNCGA